MELTPIEKEQQMAWDEFAPTYAQIQAESQLSLPGDVALFLRQKGILPGGSLLDVAAGAGRFIAAFTPFVGRLIETDISREMLRFGQKAATAAQAKNIEFEQVPWSALRQRQNQADVVFASMFDGLDIARDMTALSHLTKNWVVIGHFVQRVSHLDQTVAQAFDLEPDAGNYNRDQIEMGLSALKELGKKPQLATFQFATREQLAVSILLADLAPRLRGQTVGELETFLKQTYQKKPIQDQIDYTYQLLYWQP